MSRNSGNEREEAFVAAYERLVDALADDLVGASNDEILASHTPAAARVAADALRQRLHRDASGSTPDAGPPEMSLGPSPDRSNRPERKP